MKGKTGSLLFHILALGTPLVLLYISTSLGLFQNLELLASDILFNIRGPQKPATDIIIIAIDSESFIGNKLQWPWSNSYLATIVNQVAKGRPAVVALDLGHLSNPDPQPNADAELAQALKNAGNTVLASIVDYQSFPGGYRIEIKNPVPNLRDNASVLGVINVPIDSDGITRVLTPSFTVNGKDFYYSFAVEVASLYVYKTPYKNAPQRYSFPVQSEFVINYRGSSNTFRTIPAYLVANGAIPANEFSNKIILIGKTDPSLHDSWAVPFGKFENLMPGVEIWANAIDSIIANDYFVRVDLKSVSVFILISCLIGYVISHIRFSHSLIVLILGVTTGYLAVWLSAFYIFRLQIPVIALEVGFGLGCLTALIKRTRLSSSVV